MITARMILAFGYAFAAHERNAAYVSLQLDTASALVDALAPLAGGITGISSEITDGMARLVAYDRLLGGSGPGERDLIVDARNEFVRTLANTIVAQMRYTKAGTAPTVAAPPPEDAA